MTLKTKRVGAIATDQILNVLARSNGIPRSIVDQNPAVPIHREIKRNLNEVEGERIAPLIPPFCDLFVTPVGLESIACANDISDDFHWRLSIDDALVANTR